MYVIDSQLRSFVPVAEDSDFPLQNLPYGVFSQVGASEDHIGVAIGEQVLDLCELSRRGQFDLPELREGRPLERPILNDFMALGREAWEAVRRRTAELLSAENPTLRDNAELRSAALVRQADVSMRVPASIGDYTDFYSSREHATNVGTIIRGADNALQPNWLHLPVAYHGRASSIVIDGTDVTRPVGQKKPGDDGKPGFGPSAALDFELEMGFFIGPGSSLGEPVSVHSAEDHIFGLVLVNDWSARDIQTWEYVPLGPFLSKNFATSISPWVVTLDALEPFRTASPPQDPEPLPYLQGSSQSTFDIPLTVAIQGAGTSSGDIVCRSNFRYLYWSMAQQIAHHTITGCNLRPGDLLASGTISGPEKSARGSMLELTWRGAEPIKLSDGSQRKFLSDGDVVSLSGSCEAKGCRVGFGSVSGCVLPARA
ncbi:MAG: fumarylacetoacetase [Pirellulales bacterium]|nr:fumarylacetoacetase [Pirellulales bacterium]